MRYLLAALLTVALQMPAVAQEPMLKTEIEVKPVRFKDRHPLLYKSYRKVRHYCICVKPIIDCAGSVCQVVLVFL